MRWLFADSHTLVPFGHFGKSRWGPGSRCTFSTLKNEIYHHQAFANRMAARTAVVEFIEVCQLHGRVYGHEATEILVVGLERVSPELKVADDDMRNFMLDTIAIVPDGGEAPTVSTAD